LMSIAKRTRPYARKSFGLTGEKHEQFEYVQREEPCHRTCIARCLFSTCYDAASNGARAVRAQIWELSSQNRTIRKLTSRRPCTVAGSSVRRQSSTLGGDGRPRAPPQWYRTTSLARPGAAGLRARFSPAATPSVPATFRSPVPRSGWRARSVRSQRRSRCA